MSEPQGQRCGIDNCRSKRFRRADDGLLYCSYGHQRDAPLLISVDDEDYRAPSQRVTKVSRDGQHASLSRAASNFADAEAVEQYLRCFQSVLVKQVEWLITIKDFSTQYEHIVKDLWSLRLQMLDPLISKAANHDVGIRMHSSQSSRVADARSSGTVTSLASAVRLEDCLAILYLSAVLMQLPVMTRDVLDWVQDDAFPFLRVEQYFPPQTYRRLPLTFRKTFHNRTGAPHPGALHSTVINLAQGYMQSPSPIEWPSINCPPILFRVVTETALPIEVFSATLKLVRCLGIKTDFSLLNTKYKHAVDHPEIQLVALLLISVKLLYPFDGAARPPTSTAEAATLTLNWHDWAKAFNKHPIIGTKEAIQEEVDQPHDNWNVHEHDVLDMDGERIDKYLNWFQETWINEEIEEQAPDRDLQRELRSLFPLTAMTKGVAKAKDSKDVDSTLGRLKRVQSALAYCPPAASRGKHYGRPEMEKPGSHYKQYRTVDDVPDVAKLFFELMAHLSAVSVEMLVSAVFRMERRLRRWDEAEAKKAAVG